MMKLKEIDCYTYSVILAIIGIVALLGVNKSKNYILFSLSCFLLTAIVLYFYGYRGKGSIVRNDYEGKAYTKSEADTCQPQELQPKQTRTGIDGIVTNYDKKRVFKVSNGIKTKINKAGKIKETTLIGRIINTGYTDKLKNNDCWSELYNKVI